MPHFRLLIPESRFLCAHRGVPGRTPSSRLSLETRPLTSRRIASQVDLAPTILDLLGLPTPEDYQGRSLLGERDETALFFTDYSIGLLGLRDGRWKFIHEIGGGGSKLYDLATDPMELQSVAEQHAEQVTRYREYLLRWAAAQKGLLLEHR